MAPTQDGDRRDRDQKRTSSKRGSHHGEGAAARDARRSLLSSFFGSTLIPGFFGPPVSPGTQPSKSRTHRHHHPDRHSHQQHDENHSSHHHDHHHRQRRVESSLSQSSSSKSESRNSESSQHSPFPRTKNGGKFPEHKKASVPHSIEEQKRKAAGTTHNLKTKAPKQRREEKKRFKLSLKPLQDGYLSWVLNIQSGLLVTKLKDQIRLMYRNKGTRLPASVRIQLYDPETLKKLGVDAKFTSSGTVWYRVLRYDDTTADTWKFSSQRGEIGKAFTAELTKAIESGATVGDLRRKVAEYRKVADVNRIRVYAEDGMHRGVLMGNDWVLDEIGRAWLCKWLSLDVRAEGRYVLLKGMRRKGGYVFHPTNRDFHTQAKEWSVKLVKSYMERDLFSSVGSSKLEKGLRKRIVLQFEGESVGDEEKVKWGGTYELELPVDDAEAFNGEEAWLFSEGSAEACVVCGDEKKVDGFPPRITEACKHEVSICKGCLGKWLESSAEAGNWKRLKCPDPECKELLEYGSVKRYASAETFERYDRWMLNDALQGVAWFEWCLASKCDYGHIHDPACEVFQCRNPKCGKTHCIKHHIFHDDETCQEYDRRQLRRAQENQRSEKVVKEMAKECPNCKRMVHKTQGCNHMTCTCRHEWCYICFAPFMTAGTTGILLCHHNPGCTESPQPFAHLFDREGNLLNPGAQELRNVQVFPPPPPFANRRRPITQAGMRRQNGQRPHIAADGPEALPLFVPQTLLGRTALGARRAQQQRRGLLLAP